MRVGAITVLCARVPPASRNISVIGGCPDWVPEVKLLNRNADTFLRVATRRFDDRPRTRAPGAGRPRRIERTAGGPVDAEIVGAAARLFSKQGVNATTMAQIADAVGLGVSSVYYYFGNKNQLVERIVIEVNRAPLAIARVAAHAFADAPRRLHAFIRHDAAALCEFPFDFNEIHRLAGDDRENFSRYWIDRRQLAERVEGFVRQGIDDGDFLDVDVELAARTVLANDEAIQNWYRQAGPDPDDAEPRLSPAAIGEFIADLGVRGLLREPGRLESIRSDTSAPLTA